MDESNLVTAILTIREQVGFLWNVYVTSCVFLIGWIFSSKSVWTETKRKVIIGLFAAFALVNLSAIYNEYGLLAVATDQLYAMSSSENRFLTKLSNDAGIGSLLASIIHLGADAFIIYLINFRCRGSNNA